MSCPDRNLAIFHHCRRYEGLRLLPSVCEQIIIQQTLIIRSIILRKKIPYFSIRSFTLKVIAPIMLIAVVTTFVTNIVYGLFEEGFSRLIIDFMTVFIVGGILTMIIALNREQRQKMVMLIKEKIKR